jgi:type IV pilus assembly protein PilM
MNDITSTEKLLDLIRKKKSGPAPAVVTVKSSPPPQKNIRLVLSNKPAGRKSINVGIDIGHESLRMVKMERISDSKWKLIDYQTIPFTHRMRKGTPDFINFFKMELTRFCGSYKKIQIWAIMSSANVAVRHIRIPKVPKNQIENAVFWTIKKESPFNERETVLDFEVMEESLDQGVPKWVVMAYTAPTGEVEAIKNIFSKIAFPLTGITIVSFAVQTLFRTGWLAKSADTIAYLFIGNDFSRIDIFRKGNLIMTRGIKAGINSMIESLLEVLHLEDTEGDTEDNKSAIGLERVRKVLFSLSPDSAPLAEGDPGYSLSEEEKFSIILPALERLVRQVERTFDHFNINIAPDKVSRIYVTSSMNMYSPLITYVGEQLGIESEVLDPLDPVISGFSSDQERVNLSERVALTPALGMALSDNAHTPNLLFTFHEKQQVTNINRVNRGIFALLAIATLLTAGFFFYQLALYEKKKTDISSLQNQLARYQPYVNRTDILDYAAKSKQRNYSSRAYSERYGGMAVIGELSALTPANIRLVNLKADFGAGVTEKIDEPQKVALQDAAVAGKTETTKEQPREQAASTGMGNLTLEGIVFGSRQSLESSLAGYLMKLQDSPIFRQVTIQGNRVERVNKRDILHFTIHMKMASA